MHDLLDQLSRRDDRYRPFSIDLFLLVFVFVVSFWISFVPVLVARSVDRFRRSAAR
jgi:hypothetical protein